jgi:hypothetical protein
MIIFLLQLALVCANLVNIEVYLGSKHKSNIEFVTKQIVPAVNLFTKLPDLKWNVTLIFYGNAQETCTSSNECIYDCPYGPNECKGMIYLGCLLHIGKMDNTTFNAVGCTLDVDYPVSKKIEQCSNKYGFNFNDVYTCADGDLGMKIMHHNHDLTNNADPDYFPWIIVNRIHNEDEQFQAQNNLIEYLNLTNV